MLAVLPMHCNNNFFRRSSSFLLFLSAASSFLFSCIVAFVSEVAMVAPGTVEAAVEEESVGAGVKEATGADEAAGAEEATGVGVSEEAPGFANILLMCA